MKKLIVVLLLLLCGYAYAESVNEDSTAVLTMTFKDELGVATQPNMAQVRIDDVLTGSQVRDWVDISPLSSTVNVMITDLENAILKQNHNKEPKRVTVRFSYGAYKGKADYVYDVVNLNKIP